MPLVTAGKDAAMDYMAANKLLYLSAHTVDDPGTGGSNEVSGGSYARVALAWGASSGGVITATGMPETLLIPAGTTVKSLGFWTASSGGTFMGKHDITDEVYGSNGSLVINSLTYTY